MEEQANDVPNATILALLSCAEASQQTKFQEILPNFSSSLKVNFENPRLWLRYGLTLSLSQQSSYGALQAFNECMRIDQQDPLPAMLAAKLLLKDLDDPERALESASEAIRRCKQISSSVLSPDQSSQSAQNHLNQNADCDQNHSNGAKQQSTSSLPYPPQQLSCRYKTIAPLLSRSYLLASITHAYIYEREPESIRRTKLSSQEESLKFLNFAIEAYPNDHLLYFHKALHEARQKSYSSAIDNLREAIKLDRNHIPSMQLLILSLSGLKLYDDALSLCESTLQNYENDLLLLYIKCNLEQCLVETKGYKAALSTAQNMLKVIRQSTTSMNSRDSVASLASQQQSVATTTPAAIASVPTVTVTNLISEPKQTINLFADDSSIDQTKRLGVLSNELSIWLLVAEIFVKIGSIEDAEMCVDESSTHANGALSHQIMFTRGLISKAKNNLLEAKNYFQSALALCPRHAKALQQIAHVHYLLGNHSTAEKFLRDSLDFDNECYKTWHYLSLVCIETNQHDKARECAKKSTHLEESSPVISLSAISRLTLQ